MNHDLLDSLLATLEQLRRLLPPDKAVWEDQMIVRLAIERLWITAGNLAEAYRTDQQISGGVEPWAELAGFRNLLAHALPGDISSDRVYAHSLGDIDRLIDEVRGRPPERWSFLYQDPPSLEDA